MFRRRKEKLWRESGQRGTEIFGFVGSEWHSLPLLKPCDPLTSLVWCQFAGLGDRRSAMSECTLRAFNFISKALIVQCCLRIMHVLKVTVFSFV